MTQVKFSQMQTRAIEKYKERMYREHRNELIAARAESYQMGKDAGARETLRRLREALGIEEVS